MLNDIVDIGDLISQLQTIQGYCEWNYPTNYLIAIDDVIELLKEIQRSESK